MSEYFKIPHSLESDPKWISYSLKRRWLFLFLVSKAVFSENHIYKGINLTYGQYLISERGFVKDFNETVGELEDKIDRSYVQRSFKKFKEDGFIDYKIISLAIHQNTLITITHLDTYNLIKNSSDPRKSTSDPLAIHKENILEIHPKMNINLCSSNNVEVFSKIEKLVCDPQKNNFKNSERSTQKEQREKNIKEQQPQTPSFLEPECNITYKTSPVVDVVVFSCLEKIKDSDVSRTEKIKITKKYFKDEKTVIDAVDVVTHSDFIPETSILKSLRAALKGKWNSNAVDLIGLDKNKNLAKKLENVKHPYQFVALNDSLQIVKGPNCDFVVYKLPESKFWTEVEKQGKINLTEAFKKQSIT